MSPPPFSEWLVAFVWTNALELPIYVLLLRRSLPRWWFPCAFTLIVNSITHPLLWYVWYVHLWFEPSWLWLCASECWVTLTESILAAAALALAGSPRRLAIRRGFLAAFLANLASTLLGMLLFR